MKKNRMMRIAAVMMVLALVTTCVISGSFAKYVTTGTAAEDSARVAKWGVTVSAASSTLEVFKTSYNKDSDTSIGVTVQGTQKLVAPGTKNQGAAIINVAGTPEVAVRVAYTGSITLTGWEVDGEFYCPLIISVGVEAVNGADFTSLEAFQNAVNALLTTTTDYAPGTNLATAASKTVSWEWPFSTSPENDLKDTALGNAAANGTAPTVTISLNATVTQID